MKFCKNDDFCLSKGRKQRGKGESVGYQHFLLLPQFFLKAFFFMVEKVGIVWYWINID